MLNTAARATPATRVRLVYRISSGALANLAGARQAVDKIRDFLRGQAIPAFIVSDPTAPTPAGATGSGVWGVVSAIAGRNDYTTAVDLRTNYDLATMTWGELLAPARAIPLGLVGLDVAAQLDSAETVDATSPAAVSPARQQRAADQAAASGSVPLGAWPAIILGTIVVLALAWLAYRYLRRAA